MPKIYIIGTGGTISGVGDNTSALYESGVLPVQDILSSVPGIEQIATITATQYLNVDSNDITEQNWVRLAKHINASANGFDGFVVTHGTDTLEETAYFLNLTVKTRKPVVVVGSMRAATSLSADGPMNLFDAVTLAGHPASQGRGVMVVLNNCIYSARTVQKTNTFRVDAFNGSEFGHVGYLRNNQPYFLADIPQKHTVDTPFDVSKFHTLPPVGIAYYHVGADPAILSEMAKRSRGIVIAGAGEGDFGRAWGEKIRRITSQGVPVVRSTRIISGMVQRNHGMPDDRYNTIAAGTLNPQKARILLALGLLNTNNFEELQKMFELY